MNAKPTQPAPSDSSGIVGRLVKTACPRKPPVTASACGLREELLDELRRQIRLAACCA